MPSLKHEHTYERMKSGSYRCIDPDCSHFIRPELVKGKRAMCTCGKTYLMDKRALRLKKPHCEDCTRGHRVVERKESIAEVLAGVPELESIFANIGSGNERRDNE